MYNIKITAVEQIIKLKVENYLTRLKQKLISKPKHCHICGHAGYLTWHQSYERSLITMTETYRLPIKRVKCGHCHHTFAILPEFVMKFYHYAKETIFFAIEMLKTCTYEAVADKFMGHENRCLAIVTLHFWRRKFA